jgi:arylsulfatase A-like enzyme
MLRTAIVLALCIVATACTGGASSDGARSAVEPGRPNILLIVTDDQTLHTWQAMPEVRRQILAHGMRFDRAYVSNPLCCPSRATILTGDYSHTTGVYGNAGPHGGFRSFYNHGDEAHTLATALDPTYDTALFGKYLNGYATYSRRVLKQAYVPPGWNEWQAFDSDNGAYYRYRLNVDGQFVDYGNAPTDYSTDVLGERLRDWLDASDGDGRNPDEPFFAYLAAFSPHLPSDASRTYHDGSRFTTASIPTHPEADVRDKPAYIRRLPPPSSHQAARLLLRWREQLQSLRSYDRQIGLTLDLLRAQGVLDDTVVIVISDNGVEYGEHRWESKGVPYEYSVRVPFAIRFDQVVHTAAVDRHLVGNVDVYPTILDLASVGGSNTDGRSLRPLLDGGDPPWRSSILLEGPYDDRGLQPSVPTYCGIVTDRWKYVVYSPAADDPTLVSGPEDDELYDLRTDPGELRNVVRSRPDVARRLRRRLASLCRPSPPGWRVRW